MSDYIFTTRPRPKGELTGHIQSIYHAEVPEVFEYHGDWGSLGVSRNLYTGFHPVETDRHIFVVIGGPVLCFRDNLFLTGNDLVAGTQALYNRWLSGTLKWDEDLSGPFAVLVVDKNSHEIQSISDLMSFIPIYETVGSAEKALSTHVDLLSKVTGLNEIDKVSVADFILHGIVTFPYTFYKSIRQMNPATIMEFNSAGDNIQEDTYWLPVENCHFKDINEAAVNLRQALQSYIDRVVESINPIGLFISGGEDSRAVLAMLPKEKDKQAFILLDNMNREGKIAARAAQAFGAEFNLIEREKLRYLKVIPECSDLVGSGSQYFHAHTFGYQSWFGKDRFDAVFGGFAADRLLKCCHLPRLRGVRSFPFLPQVKQPFSNKADKNIPEFINQKIALELKNRRQDHHDRLHGFRNYNSVDEWFNVWPSSMAVGAPYANANRRLFKSYEPFLDNKVVKIGSVIDQSWKLNCSLYQKSLAPLMKPVRSVPHCKKGFTYYPWYINIIATTGMVMGKYIKERMGQQKEYQGPWADWPYLLKTEEWTKLQEEIIISSPCIQEIFSCSIQKLFSGKKMHHIQELNLIQSIYNIHGKL